jgi:hypothetical protein
LWSSARRSRRLLHVRFGGCDRRGLLLGCLAVLSKTDALGRRDLEKLKHTV